MPLTPEQIASLQGAAEQGIRDEGLKRNMVNELVAQGANPQQALKDVEKALEDINKQNAARIRGEQKERSTRPRSDSSDSSDASLNDPAPANPPRLRRATQG